MKLPNFPNPLKSFAPAPAGPALATAGANGGHMMFASSGGSGGGGYDDDDYGFDDDYAYEDDPEPAPERPANKRSSQARSKSGSAAGSGRSRSASYQSEERYWTDYLRIALPVIGIVLMLGLLWIWASHLLGGPSDDGDITSTDTVGLVTTTTPEPTEVSTPSTNAGEIPIGNTQPTQPPVAPTPTNTPTSGDNQTDGTETEEETPEAPTNIEPDAYVLITEDEVNMRKTPSTSGDVVRQVRRGELFQVRSGPEDADGYTWWEVVSDEEGDSGYIVENFLELTD